MSAKPQPFTDHVAYEITGGRLKISCQRCEIERDCQTPFTVWATAKMIESFSLVHRRCWRPLVEVTPTIDPPPEPETGKMSEATAEVEPIAPLGQRCDRCGWAIFKDLFHKPADFFFKRGRLLQWCLDPKACEDRIREQEEGPRHRGIHSGPTVDSPCDDPKCWCRQ